MCLDTRSDPNQNIDRITAIVEKVETIHLVERIDDDPLHPCVDRHRQLGQRFVVAMEDEIMCRNSGIQRDVELAGRRHIDVHALFVNKLGHGLAEKGFRGIGDTRTERLDRFSRPAPQMVFVIDEQRRTELGSKIDDGTSADRERSVRRTGGGIGQQGEGNRVGHSAMYHRRCFRRPTSHRERRRRAA